MINNYGYMVNKCDLTSEKLAEIKNDLTVKPMIKSSFMPGNKEPDSFAIYQEGATKLLLPKYYAIEKLGMPKQIETHINDMDRINVKFAGKPRDYQMEIINQCKQSFLSNENASLKAFGGGIITIPPGRGKTFIALYLVWLLKVKTLIVVHTEFLVGQWRERIHQYIPNAKIGVIQGKKINTEGKDIVIGMLQSISGKEYDDDIFEGFPLVIFDEVHHLGAKMFSKALLKIQAPYTLGLSATPKRKDKLDKVFMWHLGPMIYEMYAQIDASILIKMYNFNLSTSNAKYKKIYSGWAFNGKMKQINTGKMVTNLTELEQRNVLILNMIKDAFPIFPPNPEEQKKYNKYKLKEMMVFDDDNLYDKFNCEFQQLTLEIIPYKYVHNYRKLIILTDRREHLASIEKMLIASDPLWHDRIGYYVGGMKEHELKRSEQMSIILATFQMASEALDIKGLDTLILATPQSDVVQASGRILREEAHKRKNIPTIYDIIDTIDFFKCQAKKRYMDYVSKEYQIEWYDVLDTNMVQGQNSLGQILTRKNKKGIVDDDFIDD